MENCPNDIWRHGRVVGVLTSVASKIMETYVEILREKSGIEKLDWHWMGGRALIRAIATNEELEKLDKVMYWNFSNEGKLQDIPCKSAYGYHPGGRNHWTTQPEPDKAIFIVAAIRDVQEEQEAAKECTCSYKDSKGMTRHPTLYKKD
jgi:hypothetical protein